MKAVLPRYIIIGLLTCAGLGTHAYAVPTEVIIDTVVASINGKPITLKELCKRLRPPRTLSLSEASQDYEARSALDGMILEELILQEAETKKVSVSDEDVDHYIDQVAQRNGLSRDGFETELQKEGKNLSEYKEMVKVDILRTKLASSLVQSGIGVSTQEVDDYIKDHPELSGTGAKLKLRRIFISSADKGDEAAKAKLEEVKAEIHSTEDFTAQAAAISESPERADGGSLGVMAESDLSSDLFDTIFGLKEGEVSAVHSTQGGYQIFMVEERFVEDGEENKKDLQTEVRRTLEQQKVRERMESYFTVDLYKNYSVDKKI